jgi:hypothetical protein
VSDFRKEIKFMSKKNRRKTLQKKEGIIRTSEFNSDDSKIYIIATLIMFHIVPLIFIAFGEVGKAMYSQAFYLSANVLFISITGVIYGLKKGFNFKFPIIMAALAILSLIFYGDFAKEAALAGRFLIGCVYVIWAYVATVIGGFLKKLFRL